MKRNTWQREAVRAALGSSEGFVSAQSLHVCTPLDAHAAPLRERSFFTRVPAALTTRSRLLGGRSAPRACRCAGLLMWRPPSIPRRF